MHHPVRDQLQQTATPASRPAERPVERQPGLDRPRSSNAKRPKCRLADLSASSAGRALDRTLRRSRDRPVDSGAPEIGPRHTSTPAPLPTAHRIEPGSLEEELNWFFGSENRPTTRDSNRQRPAPALDNDRVRRWSERALVKWHPCLSPRALHRSDRLLVLRRAPGARSRSWPSHDKQAATELRQNILLSSGIQFPK